MSPFGWYALNMLASNPNFWTTTKLSLSQSLGFRVLISLRNVPDVTASHLDPMLCILCFETSDLERTVHILQCIPLRQALSMISELTK